MYGVIQGRLLPQESDFIQSFPWGRWEEEFDIAREVKASHIEWIWTECGSVLQLDRCDVRKLPVVVSAVCLDVLISDEFISPSFRSRVLADACATLQKQRIKKLVLPFLEKASLAHDTSLMLCVMMELVNVARTWKGITFSLETDLDPYTLEAMMQLLNKHDDVFRITMDTGNMTKHGIYIPDYDKHVSKWVDNVHVKDFSKKLGSTVPLGQGNTSLDDIEYIKGWPRVEYVTFQTARGENGKEKELFMNNVAFVNRILGYDEVDK